MKIIFLLSLIISSTFAYKTIIDVLSEDAKFSMLIGHLQRTRLIPFINSLEAGTFFAPDNLAFSKYKGDVTKDSLLYHLLSQPYTTSSFKDGQVLESVFVRQGYLETGQMLKVTQSFQTFYYVNEARIKEKDVFVNKNTTLHVIDGVLESPKILSHVIQQHDYKLFDLMKKCKIDLLLEHQQPFTAFVSAKYLLDKFKKIEQKYLISKHGIHDLEQIIKYVIIPKPIYLYNHTVGDITYTAESGDDIKVHVNTNGQITVNGHRVIEKDILAANGVVHVLDDLPFRPNSIVFDSRKYLIGLNATKFVSLIDKFGLSHFLNNQTSNITILAPTNEVIDEDDIPNNQKKQWLSYHLLQGSWEPSKLTDGTLLKTEFNSSLLNNESQRLVVRLDKNGQSPFIRFGDHSNVIGHHIPIVDNMIYRISDPLSLPTDIFSSLVLDLELSTFISVLYVSGTVEEIKQTKAMTLFAPTNEAFKSLGLVSRYLIHPTGHDDLRHILRYHLATRPLYYQDMIGQLTFNVTTLANQSLTIHNQGNDIWIGTKGRVQKSDLIVSNGVVHKLDHVQIPNNIHIAYRNLLRGIRANTMLNILKNTNLLNVSDCIILAPTDKAFEELDMESIWNDTKRLERLAKLHVLPLTASDRDSHEYKTLTHDKIVIRELGFGIKIVGPKGEAYSRYARVLDIGNTTAGAVFEIDSVLFPVERGLFGLPWLWSAMIISVIWIVILAVLFLGGFIVFKKWKRTRDGYETILEAEADDIAEEEEEEQQQQQQQ
ncbi:FAS1 domain-containing protein [Cokeromyces recurvatus]|uniref:FAS1 domain-containing protein n=1 Tax=Cokeromyces recurvatus TaxID=90255 RepID=UPI00221FFEAD|nr:FAS1 domain-containing protein [Cokeromyces recurvatus]KAI7898866.1 FAS1 domain-containing protein [Cokeromyces recurvatus]